MRKLLSATAAALLLVACGGPAEPAPTVTVTTTATATTTVTVTAKPTQPPAPKTFDGKPEDFIMSLTVTEMKCFGSAGCNVNYRIDPPSYQGTAQFPSTGSVEVLYEIQGATDVIKGKFVVKGGKVNWDDTGFCSVANADAVLTPVVTTVTYLPY